MVNRKNVGIEVGSILVFAAALFVLVSLATYHAADPSYFTNATGAARNACGKVGAYFASSLLSGFGLGAFLFPFALFLIAATIQNREGMTRVIGGLGGLLVAVTSLTVFLSVQRSSIEYGGGHVLTGGVLGAWVAEGLRRELNEFGTSLISLLICTLALVISTPLSVAQVGAQILRAFALIVSRSARLLGSYLFYGISWLLFHGFQGARQGGVWALRNAQGMSMRRSSAALPETIPVHKSASRPILPSEPEAEPDSGIDSSQEEQESKDDLFSNFSSEPQDEESTVTRPSDFENGIKILPREADLAMKGPSKAPKTTVRTRKGQWQLPTIEFLKNPPKIASTIDRDRLVANSQILRQKFADFGIDGEVTAVRPGPVITLYEFKPGPGVKVSRIAALADDLSMALSAQSVRILAPLPGKSVVGIEIPSDTRETVYLREFLQHPDFYGTKHMIPVIMGKEIGGQTYLSDLGRMPHLLCAGQTGSGKSVFMNGLICSLFYRFTPDELRMILVDPKFIEFRAYQDMPHLLLPVVDDPKQASIALKWAVREMERRYRILARMGARNLASFNQKVDELGCDVVKDLLVSQENSGESSGSNSTAGGDWIEAFEPDEHGVPKVGKLPYIVVIIDELADLMMIAKKEVEISIARIAQKARAAGIHLVIATQRPSTDVITGLIKANLPSRVSFQLASYVDSKTILDRAGAERLLGQGDMLFIPPGVSQTMRLHGAYLDDDEIGKITTFLKAQGKPVYRDEILLADDDEDSEEDSDDASDDLFIEAVNLVKTSGHASASFLQRHLKVGYNRAARMIETMESRGIVGPQDGSRPREVLIR